MELDLFDNGALADTNGGDGVYARYFTSPTAANRYSVVCTAWNDGGAYTSRRNSSKVSLPDFSRMESGGSVRVSLNFPVNDSCLIVQNTKCIVGYHTGASSKSLSTWQSQEFGRLRCK